MNNQGKGDWNRVFNLSGVVLAGLVLVPAAFAAELEVVEYLEEYRENGELIESTREAPRGTGSFSSAATMATATVEPSEPSPVGVSTAHATVQQTLEILPEAGEEAGDRVCFNASFAQSVAATAEGDHADASATSGLNISASGEANDDPLSAQAESQGEAIEVVRNPSAEAEVLVAFDALTVDADDSDSHGETSVYLARIGDFIGLRIESLGVAAAVYPGSAEADASTSYDASIAEDFYACAEPFAIEVGLSTVGSGSIETSPEPPPFYLPDDEVELLAVPEPGWAFIGWSGDASGNENPLAVTFGEDTNIEARFTRITPVPVLSPVGLAALFLTLMGVGMVVARRTRRHGARV